MDTARMATKWIALKESANYQGLDAGSTFRSGIAASENYPHQVSAWWGFSYGFLTMRFDTPSLHAVTRIFEQLLLVLLTLVNVLLSVCCRL